MTTTLASPREEVRAALRNVGRPGLFAPDMAAAMTAVLTEAMLPGPGVLELARVVNARAARPPVVPLAGDPIDVANAVHAEPSPLSELHQAQHYYEAAPGAEEPDVDVLICGHCTNLANTPVGWPCATALAAGLAQPTPAPMPAGDGGWSMEAPF
jgi:hypothetical protein